MYYDRMYLEAMLNLFDCTCVSAVDVMLCAHELTVLPLQRVPEPLLHDDESRVGPLIPFNVTDLEQPELYSAMIIDKDKKLFVAHQTIALVLKIARECMDYYLALCIKRLRADMFPQKLTEVIAHLIGHPLSEDYVDSNCRIISSLSTHKTTASSRITTHDDNDDDDSSVG
uniref:MORC family CW-type zinc finger protein 2 n=1 Tax=Lygus hesperus TaxID=30085 RepID=A0A0A9YAL7_LYGHE